MIEQEAVETPVEEKSMARLAEILRAHGVDVVQVIDGPKELSARLVFRCNDEEQALEISDFVFFELGYPLSSLKRSWSYLGNLRTRPRWAMVFPMTRLDNDVSHKPSSISRSQFSHNLRQVLSSTNPTDLIVRLVASISFIYPQFRQT